MALAPTWTADAATPARVSEAACARVRRRVARTLRLHTALAAANGGALDFLHGSVVT
jgi:hypothetical protein